MKKELAEKLEPRVTGWFGQENVTKFDIFNSVFAPGARRFETGTPSFISIYAAYEALNLLLKVGIHNIQSYLKKLAEFTRGFGIQKGLQITGPLSTECSSGLTSFYIGNAPEVEGILREKNIIVSARKDVIRMAPHFYNTKDELEYAITELSNLANR
ncbi:aminotransferase class V-fold PLP-dependent enzyme [Neobacillus niacini]|nr:aminotransferase class V-fold PLP-dependent enzyme [Neobacillus niacini]